MCVILEHKAAFIMGKRLRGKKELRATPCGLDTHTVHTEKHTSRRAQLVAADNFNTKTEQRQTGGVKEGDDAKRAEKSSQSSAFNRTADYPQHLLLWGFLGVIFKLQTATGSNRLTRPHCGFILCRISFYKSAESHVLIFCSRCESLRPARGDEWLGGGGGGGAAGYLQVHILNEQKSLLRARYDW